MWSSIPTISAFDRTMSRISFSDLRVCSRSGKAMLSNMFMEPKRAPVLEQHAELPADPVEVLLPHPDGLLALDPDLAGCRGAGGR